MNIKLKLNVFVFFSLNSFCVLTWDHRVSIKKPRWSTDSLVASRPRPYIFCLVAHQSKIACQAEVSVSWQDAPVTFQLERASVLQPSGQISENRSSREELSAIQKAGLYQTPNAPMTLTSGTAGVGGWVDSAGAAVRRNKVMFCWAWPDSVHLIGFKREKTLTLINLLNPLEHGERGVELRGLWGEGRGVGSLVRWATPVVCMEHGPLKCALTFIRISLTPIMGKLVGLEKGSPISADLTYPPYSPKCFRLG